MFPSASAPPPPPPQSIDVRRFGAKVDGATDDTAAATAAIVAAYNAGGGKVYVPPGIMLVNGLTLLNHVWIVGAGMHATTIQLRPNSNTNVITNFVSPDAVQANAMFVGVMDMTVDGNKSHQTAASNGINYVVNPLSNSATHDDQFDSHQLVRNVKIVNAYQHSFFANGRSEMRLDNVYSSAPGQNGFFTTFDFFMTNCTSETAGYEGFYITHSNNMISNCKSFDSGQVLISRGAGFYVSSGNALTLSNCNAQNNLAQGFNLVNCQGVIMQACMADSNNFGTGNANTAYAGVEISGSTYNIIDFSSTQSFQNGTLIGNQYDALRIKTSTYNDIRLNHSAQAGYTAGPAITSDSTTTSNNIMVNGHLTASY